MKGYWRAIGALLGKDLRGEWRAREAWLAMALFAVLTLVMLNFSMRLRVDSMRPLGPAALWIAILLSGTLGLNRSMAAEQAHGAFDALLLAPHDPSYIFVAKALANALGMLSVGLLALPIGAVLFDERLLNVGVIGCILMGTFAYAGVGTLTALLAANTRMRDALLPVLVFPLALPLIVAAVLASAGFVYAEPWQDFGAWLGVMAAYSVIFWTAGTLLFENLIYDSAQ